MDPSPPRDAHQEPPDAAAQPGLASGALAVRMLASATDADQIERMLIALALHPEGVGFERAQLLLWESRADRLKLKRRGAAERSAAPLREVLERARLGDRSESGPRRSSGRLALSPSMLEGPAAIAWQRGACAVGSDRSHAGGDGAQVGAAPLRWSGRTIGVVIGEWQETGEPTERQAALESLASIAESALLACHRTRDVERLSRQLAALSEMARAMVSPANLAEVLHLAARLAASASGARGSALWLAGTAAVRPPQGDGDVAAPRLEFTYGPPSQRERLARALQPVATAVVASSRPRIGEPETEELLLSPESSAALAAYAVLPLVAYRRTLGALAVYDPAPNLPGEPSGFGPTQIEFLTALADLAALTVDHGCRFLELRQSALKNGELTAQLRRQERLSSLGEQAARAAHEARSPLASIRTFARRARHELAEDDPRHEYLEIVAREADRLERILGEPLEYTSVEPPALKLGSLNEVMQDTLQRAGEILVRRRIRLLKKLAPDLPSLLLDVGRIRHVLSKILEGALEAVATGGRIRVESRRVAQHVVLEVAHDGRRFPGESLEHLFAPFATGPGASALGLGVVQRIVREHGGEIRVRAEGEWSTVVTLTVPIHENQDRRRVGERRGVRNDRRTRGPV